MTNVEMGLETVNDPELAAAIRRWAVLYDKMNHAEEALNAMPDGDGMNCKVGRPKRRAQCDLEDLIEQASDARDEWNSILEERYDGATVVVDGVAYAVDNGSGDDPRSPVKLLLCEDTPSTNGIASTDAPTIKRRGPVAADRDRATGRVEPEVIVDDELIAMIERWHETNAEYDRVDARYDTAREESEAAERSLKAARKRDHDKLEIREAMRAEAKADVAADRAECDLNEACNTRFDAYMAWRDRINDEHRGAVVIWNGVAYLQAANDHKTSEVKILVRSSGLVVPAGRPSEKVTAQCQCGHDAADTIALGTSDRTVTCDVTTEDGETTRDVIIEVRGSKQIRNPALAAAIDEYIASTENYHRTIDRHQRETEEIEARDSAADVAMKDLIRELGGHAVHYRGMVWGTELVRDANPATPCLLLEV
jgi:hypothetical protein